MATTRELGTANGGRRTFRVDLPENWLVRLQERRFADLNLRERDQLQEWLVRMPDARGEELLIVRKEFDGFADKRERLRSAGVGQGGPAGSHRKKEFPDRSCACPERQFVSLGVCPPGRVIPTVG